MNEDELQAIEARVEAACRLPVADMVADWMPDKIVRNDVPALVAEVRRLREQHERWRSWAQFVWFGGGPVTEPDDDVLRARICERSDLDVIEATPERRAFIQKWFPMKT